MFMIADIKVPGGSIVRQAEDLARSMSSDMLFRGDTSRLMQLGLAYDVWGAAGEQLDAGDVAEVIRRYPRLSFKRAFNEVLNHEFDRKQPYPHLFHICSRIAHNRSPLTIVDAPAVLAAAPFDE
jgi:hypothetical protein